MRSSSDSINYTVKQVDKWWRYITNLVYFSFYFNCICVLLFAFHQSPLIVVEAEMPPIAGNYPLWQRNIATVSSRVLQGNQLRAGIFLGKKEKLGLRRERKLLKLHSVINDNQFKSCAQIVNWFVQIFANLKNQSSTPRAPSSIFYLAAAMLVVAR